MVLMITVLLCSYALQTFLLTYGTKKKNTCNFYGFSSSNKSQGTGSGLNQTTYSFMQISQPNTINAPICATMLI